MMTALEMEAVAVAATMSAVDDHNGSSAARHKAFACVSNDDTMTMMILIATKKMTISKQW